MNAQTQHLSTDDDWGWQPSLAQRKAAEKRKIVAAKKTAKLLLQAAEALREFYKEAKTAGDPVKGNDDNRLTLAGMAEEYGSFIEDVYRNK